MVSLPILNLSQATHECTYGRGCEGACCKNGRPGVFADEAERIEARIDQFLPLLRPEARELIGQSGWLSRRVREGLPMLRVAGGWCVFFNQGCVLHQQGALEGDKNLYKPIQCAIFPLAQDEKDRWYVRQKGYKGEPWDLPCLDPAASPIPAAHSLREEIELAARLDAEMKVALVEEAVEG